MTENKLRKLINKPRDPPKGERRHKPIILADSKGKRLEEHIYHDIDKEIDWNSKGGAQVEGSTNWLRRNITRKIIRYGDIWLYVWLGTCNLTTKNQKNNYISLTSETDDEIDNITRKYREIIKIVGKYPGSKVTILETPIYSIKQWNKEKGHKDPSIFEEQDEKLEKQIFTLNGIVRQINKSLGTHSPEFTPDLQASKKVRCGNKRKLKTTKYYNFNLYKRDGIHPDNFLSKAWLRKISDQAKRDCWKTQ